MNAFPEKTASADAGVVHPLRSLARRPRLAVFLAVGLAAAAGWIYLAAMVADMVPAMDMSELGPGMAFFNSFNIFAGLPAEARAALAIICLPEGTTTFGMPASEVWSLSDAWLVFVMWVMMALAMMLPSAAPMIASFAELPQPMRGSARRTPPVVVLALGYLSVWVGYGVLATAAQGALTAARMMSPMMSPATMVLAGTTLIAAGIYQFTPAKLACLLRCQRPIPFFMERRPEGYGAVYRLGIIQGLLCLGCCWALMTVMFAVGIMNVVWIAVLGFLMALEKTVHRLWIPRAIGIFLVAWGLFVLALSDAGQALLAA
ncbi:DUF2182 domain-containing protein [Stappia stellulata]|uniref:DUF2182 domain-containing protein n=1 Tax=Stappia stellulata TaxID=71235 RepID=UPI0004264CF2|nr:DUF2182 domain-containing protein [Stappia stellulata]